MDPVSHTPSWSDLHKDLLLNIAKRLDSRIDRLCLRAVCHSWRSVLPPPPRRSSQPLELPFPIGPNPDLNPTLRGFFNFAETTVYCFQPLKKISDTWKNAKCWFVKIEEADEPGVVRLKDPFYRYDYEYESFSRYLPRCLNLLDYRVSEVAKIYELRFAAGGVPELCFNELKSVIVKRVAVCSEGADFAVMVIHTGGQLSVWRMGDKKWVRINHGRSEAYYNDVVYRNGKFYAVEHAGVTISVDFSLKVTRVGPQIPLYNEDNGWEMRLVNSLGNLLLLDRDSYPGGYNSDSDEDARLTYFLVYKLNEEKHEWDLVRCLENRAIFVCDICTFSVSAQDFRGCKNNCIYYSEDCFGCIHHDRPGLDAALYDTEDSSAKMLSAVFSYSGLFWPPPAWVLTHASSGR